MVGKSKLILVLSVFSLTLLTTFNNCGQVNLHSQSSVVPSPVVGISTSINYIKIPEIPEQQLRAAFLLDMSRSMAFGNCPDSIEVQAQGLTPVNCTQPSGVDINGNRFKVIRDWVTQIQASVAAGVLNESQVKLMLVPFSGGQSDTYLNLLVKTLPASKDFGSMAQFLKVLNRMEALHWRLLGVQPLPLYLPASDIQDILDMPVTALTLRSGTSIPAPRLDQLNTSIALELQNLKNQNLTRAAQFEVVFISDGVAKPRSDHMRVIVDFIWAIKKYRPFTYEIDGYYSRCTNPAPLPCEAVNWTEHNYSSCKTTCSAETNSFLQTGTINPATSRECKICMHGLQYYDYVPGQYNSGSGPGLDYHVQQMWGSWLENNYPKLFLRFATMKNVFRRDSEVRYRMNFIQLDSTEAAFKIADIEFDAAKNWISKAKLVHSKGARFSHQKDAVSPFSLFPSLKNFERYQVGQVFAINLNARVNTYGALEVDSDADGLPDLMEATAASMTNPRSDGVCLDGIRSMMNGCLNTGCDPQMDSDGDGLNECEEKTLGLDAADFDTDGDGIPDGFEVLFGLNPLASDRQKTSSMDGLTNLVHFQRGAVSDVDLSAVPGERLVHFIADLKDQKMVKDSRGRRVNSPGYYFKLKNIPLVNTKSCTDSLVMFRNPTKLDPQDLPAARLLGGAHSPGENRVLFMIRVDSLDNPGDSFWVYLEKTLSFIPEGTQSIEIDYDDFKLLNVTDPLGEF